MSDDTDDETVDAQTDDYERETWDNCPKCDAEIDEADRQRLGTSWVIYCPSCGKYLGPAHHPRDFGDETADEQTDDYLSKVHTCDSCGSEIPYRSDNPVTYPYYCPGCGVETTFGDHLSDRPSTADFPVSDHLVNTDGGLLRTLGRLVRPAVVYLCLGYTLVTFIASVQKAVRWKDE